MSNLTKNLTRAAVIAALYATLTITFAPLSFGLIQVRISDALGILPYFTSLAIPGLTLGCLIANIIGVAFGMSSAIDIIIGPLATFIAAWATFKIRKFKWLTPLPTIVITGVMIGAELWFLMSYQIPLWTCIAYVAAGEVIPCCVIGMILMETINRTRVSSLLSN